MVSQLRISLYFASTLFVIGDAVAAVAAESIEAAERALALIEVDYEVLPIVDDPQAALEETRRSYIRMAMCCTGMATAEAMWRARLPLAPLLSKRCTTRRGRCIRTWKQKAGFLFRNRMAA